MWAMQIWSSLIFLISDSDSEDGEYSSTNTHRRFRYDKMDMVKAIFFDLDGVLTTDAKGSLTVSKNICEAVPNLSVEKVLDCYRQDIELLNMGRRTMRDVWKRMCRTLKITESDALLLEVLRKTPRNDAMFDLARSLSHRYSLGIITDNSRERMNVLNEKMKLGELFDPIIVSATEHASKRDGTTALFDAALVKAHCKAKEAIFIDNQEKNLVLPAQMGMQTYWHDDAKNDIAALKTALLRWGVA